MMANSPRPSPWIGKEESAGSVSPPTTTATVSSTMSGSSSSSIIRKPIQRLSPPCSKRLRCGLLNKLGIVDERLTLPRMNHKNGNSTTPAKSVLGPQVRVLKAPLKTPAESKRQQQQSNSSKNSGSADPGILGALGSFFKVGSPPRSSTESSSAAAATEEDSTMQDTTGEPSESEESNRDRPRNLTFNETVSVVHIPRRDEYSKRIQDHLWHGTDALQENIMRNTIEFAADGWDWKNVLEEEEHIPCPESGELIHPVHCEIARMIRHERGLPVDGNDDDDDKVTVSDLLHTT